MYKKINFLFGKIKKTFFAAKIKTINTVFQKSILDKLIAISTHLRYVNYFNTFAGVACKFPACSFGET